MAGRHWLKVSGWVVSAALLLGLAFVGTALLTDRPGFCATCHEMGPYVDAWAKGTHADVWCIDCHVQNGLPARFSHKFVALGEVRSHLIGDTTFPRTKAAEVSSDRCRRCHPNLSAKTKSGFDHAQHSTQGECAMCHGDVGHKVTIAALQAADAYAPGIKRSGFVGRFAAVGAGASNVAGHTDVACARCHDMAKTGCRRCHTPKHAPKPGACEDCHKAGTQWVFSHPASGECTNCHKAPASHFTPVFGQLGPCSDCHRVGATFAFAHPPAGEEHSWRSMPCAKCHPGGYQTAYCTCHGGNAPRD